MLSHGAPASGPILAPVRHPWVLRLPLLTGSALHSAYESKCVWGAGSTLRGDRPCTPHPPTRSSRTARPSARVARGRRREWLLKAWSQGAGSRAWRCSPRRPTQQHPQGQGAGGLAGVAGLHHLSSSSSSFLPSSSWGSRCINKPPGAQPAHSGLSHKHPLPAPCGIPSWLTMLTARLPISPPSGAGARGGAQPPSPPPMTTDQTPTSPVIRQKNPATSVRPEATPDI